MAKNRRKDIVASLNGHPYDTPSVIDVPELPTVGSECRASLVAPSSRPTPKYPGPGGWRAYAEWSGLDDLAMEEEGYYGGGYRR